MLKKLSFTVLLCSSILCSFGDAQDCAPPPITANAKSSNIFSPEQEMILGELITQRQASGMSFIRDESLSSYINDIGARLAKHLPPTGLKFQYHLIDLPEANAFNIPGGHVFVTRKLIALAANEDELAGVMAHELGHAVVHHGAIDLSEAFRRVLNVTSVGDRKDIAEKYNLLLERARTKRYSRSSGHEDDKQLEADKISLFAMAAAGYDTSAFFTFFDRLTESEGKTGSWLSELFGTTRPEEKRLREILHTIDKLPPSCRDGRTAKQTDVFVKWQADVISYRATGRKEALPGLISKKELAPKLRSDISHFAFSPDGRLLLAQDDFAITIIAREPLRVLFQIPVENADEAAFTPDGKFIVFTTEALRYEKWSVEEQKPVAMRELVIRRDCWEHRLSPNGDYMACVDTSTRVNIVDTRTGKKVWEKKDFYALDIYEYLSWISSSKREDKRSSFFRIEFSPDSRIVIFSRSDKFRYRFTVDGLTAAGSENTALALDLAALKPVDIGGDLKKISARPFIFLDSDRLLGMPSPKPEDSGIFSFPSGKRLQKFGVSAQEIKRTANPDYVLVKPLANAKLGVIDMKKGALASGFNKEDVTLWNNLMAYESVNGKVLIREVTPNEKEKKFDSKDVGTIEIPVGSIKTLAAAEVSNRFDWLLLSSKTRGGLWNLEKGERKFHVRGFKGGVIADDGTSISEFPKYDDSPHSLVLMNPRDNSFSIVRELPEKGVRQYGRFVFLRRSLKEKEEEKKGDKKTPRPYSDEDTDLSRNVRYELKDFLRDQVIWSRDFPKEAPSFSFDESSGRLILYWRLGSETGIARLKERPDLQARAEALGDKTDDYLVEIVDALAQKPAGDVLLETGKGSFNIGRGWSRGDWLVVRDTRDRVLVYSIKDGALRHRFFGENASVNPVRNQVAVEGVPGEITLYDLETGEPQANLIINGRAAFVRFNPEGDRLLVISDSQSVYTFDLTKIDGAAPAQKR